MTLARFSALQRAENSSIKSRGKTTANRRMFQCSSASRKFLNPVGKALHIKRWLLFQCSSASRKFLNETEAPSLIVALTRFSALQRAENSSIRVPQFHQRQQLRFQCSSASRKFLNRQCRRIRADRRRCFSALQRAENSSIVDVLPVPGARPNCFSALQRAENSSITSPMPGSTSPRTEFQCSSASRKFLNRSRSRAGGAGREFQCSSASRKFLNVNPTSPRFGSVMFQYSSASRKFLNFLQFLEIGFASTAFQYSSASRKFLNSASARRSSARAAVSVLFSEPKIPQFRAAVAAKRRPVGFSTLQRAENSSISVLSVRKSIVGRFQYSSASRKFLNDAERKVELEER